MKKMQTTITIVGKWNLRKNKGADLGYFQPLENSHNACSFLL